ncbi:hypothetical protein VTN96DRAFT_2675 [Rasamsonia emersonii]
MRDGIWRREIDFAGEISNCEANFTSSQDLTVHQAFVLLLLSNPDSESTFILAGVAVRIGQRLGLGNDNPGLSFFEQEMRIRLWWQILFLDARASQGCPGVTNRSAVATELANIKLPLNVNDCDLYPEMSERPPEHARATEMIYCLLKYEVSTIFRHSPHAAALRADPRKITNSTVPMSTKDRLIDELEFLYNQKYLQYCDPKHLLSHMTARTQLDALIYMLNELRRRTTGELVTTAWEQVEMVFDYHPRLIKDTDNTLYVAIGDLTLKAWEAREAALSSEAVDLSRQSIPNYIFALLSRRNSNAGDSFVKTAIAAADSRQSTDRQSQSVHDNDGQAANFNSTMDETTSMSLEAPSVDWTFWEDLLQGHEPEDFGQPFFGQNG